MATSPTALIQIARARSTPSLLVGSAALLLLLVPQGLSSQMAQAEWPVSANLPAEARQFDFWVGEWDVDLRVRQADNSWPVQIQSVARIYPILNGKAVLEFWSDTRQSGIKGYSLRYFDTARDEWVLWLNWPGQNRSGSSSLSGTFTHGRGEFFSTSTGQDGTETISRYTFSDVTPASLRWDDAFSRDGGTTWTHNWIMEFTRTAAKPALPADGGPAHTWHDGTRCTDPRFRTFEFVSGRMEGEIEVGGQGNVAIVGHQVLDGCAVITHAGGGGDPERAFAFSHITWNTFANRYELTTLTSGANTPVRMFFTNGEDLVFYEQVAPGETGDRFRIIENEDGSVTWAHEIPDGNEWRPVWQARVR